jgi:transposase
MIPVPGRWWIAVAPIDMRKGIDGLASTVLETFGHNAFDGSAYLFRNRSGNRLKILMADSQGFWLCQRRLYRGGFTWPHVKDTLFELSAAQFAWLVKGIDWTRLSEDSTMRKLL